MSNKPRSMREEWIAKFSGFGAPEPEWFPDEPGAPPDVRAELLAADRGRRPDMTPPRMGTVYLIESSTGYWKIGKSFNVAARLHGLRITAPPGIELRLIEAIEVENPALIELALHAHFAAQRVHGEWFKLTAAQVHDFRALAYRCELAPQRRRP